jgi:hypothetical protein
VVRTQGDDESERRLIDDVARVGWHVVGIQRAAHEPAFAYSVGLQHTFGQPEIIILGLSDVPEMIRVVNGVGEQMRQEGSFDDWYESDPLWDGHRGLFRTVETERFAEYLGRAVWFYEGLEFAALQCVWPDQRGNYPWEPEFAAELSPRQPVLTERIGWPFHQGKNRAVFTTRQVLERGQPVVLVTHDEGGDWQFLCGTTDRTEDGRLVGLKEVVEKSPSILELCDLPAGWQAIREAPDRPWQRMRF